MTHASTDVTPAAEIAAARDLLGRHPLVDGHNDLPWTLRVADELDLDRTDLAAPVASTQTDLPRMARGGVDWLPEGLQDVSCYPALIAELASCGWGEKDIELLARGNILRVMREAEAASRTISARRGPSRVRIEDLDEDQPAIS